MTRQATGTQRQNSERTSAETPGISTERLACERCGKRLSRKRARMIDGVVLCSPCMFGQTKAVAPELLGEQHREDTTHDR